MIFVLASFLAFAHAQQNLTNGPLSLAGGLEPTATEGVLLHAPSERLVDLRAFGSRTAPLCQRVLEATRAVFDPSTSRLIDPDFAGRPVRYGAVTLTTGPQVLRTVADRFRADTLFVPVSAAPDVTVTGRVTEQLPELLAAARALEPHATQTLAIVGKFEDGAFHAESLAVTTRLFDQSHFVSVLRGEILYAGKNLMIATAHGRRLRLVPQAPVPGTEALRFVDRLDASAVNVDGVVAGFEVGPELRVFTRR